MVVCLVAWKAFGKAGPLVVLLVCEWADNSAARWVGESAPHLASY